MLEEGESLAAMLYTWRSCSVAIPSVSQFTYVLIFWYEIRRFMVKF